MNNNIAFVFPGQGSQSIGMLSNFADYPVIRDIFNQASQVLQYDMWNLIQNGPEFKLNQTEYTQPVLLAGGYAVWCLWQERSNNILFANGFSARRKTRKTAGVYTEVHDCRDRVLQQSRKSISEEYMMPSYVAGHSLGEYTALVCSQALSFADALKLVETRARLMQSAFPEGQGAMAAIIGLDDDEVIKICAQAEQGQVVSPANFNAVGQVVIGGQKEAVERAMQMAEAEGARLAKLLAMSVPSHCSLLTNAAEQFGEVLSTITISPPRIPLINNVDVEIYFEPRLIRNALVRQLYNPVQWVRTIQYMRDNGVNTIIECGPGKVLSGLIKRIDRNIKTASIYDDESLEKTLIQLRPA